jgi:hypothetical protein
VRDREVEILIGTYLGGIEPHESRACSVAGGRPMQPVGESPVTAGMKIAINRLLHKLIITSTHSILTKSIKLYQVVIVNEDHVATRSTLCIRY